MKKRQLCEANNIVDLKLTFYLSLTFVLMDVLKHLKIIIAWNEKLIMTAITFFW